MRRDEVGGRACPQNRVERNAGGANRGARGVVAGALSDVVLALVAGYPRLEERVDHNDDDEHHQDENRREEVPGPGVTT